MGVEPNKIPISQSQSRNVNTYFLLLTLLPYYVAFAELFM